MKSNETVGFEIRVLDNMLMRNLLAHVKSDGMDEMTVMHGWIIGYLYEHQTEDVFQRDIECQFEINRSTVTNILKLMEKKRYVRRVSVEQDARLKKLVLTQTGREVHENIKAVIHELDKKTLQGISEDELSTFYGVVQKLKNNLKAQELEMRAGGEAW